MMRTFLMQNSAPFILLMDPRPSKLGYSFGKILKLSSDISTMFRDMPDIATALLLRIMKSFKAKHIRLKK